MCSGVILGLEDQTRVSSKMPRRSIQRCLIARVQLLFGHQNVSISFVYFGHLENDNLNTSKLTSKFLRKDMARNASFLKEK